MSLPVATDLDPTRKADLPISTEPITTTGDADLDRIRDQVLTAAEAASETLAQDAAFTAPQRAVYELERLWSDAPRVPFTDPAAAAADG